MQAKPIIPWMGGKRRLAKHLIPLFPEHTCYVEPFAGGAAVFFLKPERAKAEVLNDINGELVNLYRVVQHHFDEFIRQFDFTLSSRAQFAAFQAIPLETMTDIQRAARFFFLQHTAFGAKPKDQHYGTGTTGRAFDATNIARTLQAARVRLAGVYVEDETWQRCVQRYDREHTFFYCDPPYWKLAGYDRAFDWPQYEALAEMMRTCKGKVMMSINDHPDIRALFADFIIHKLSIAYTVGRKKTGAKAGELIIRNY